MALDILILPSASKYSKFWAEDLKQQIDKSYDEVTIGYYEIWSHSDDRDLLLTTEVPRVKKHIRNIEDCGIVAYKEGIAVALGAIKKGLLKPKWAVYIGLPYEWLRGEKYFDEFLSWTSGYSLKTLFIQCEHDPNCSLIELRKLTHSMKNVYIATFYGKSDSDYDNIYQIANLIKQFGK